MTLDHLGIAADDASAALFKRLLDAAPYKAEEVERQGVRTLFFGDGGVSGAAPKLELLEATREDSPIARFLAARGPGLHHVAFEVRDIDAEMARVRELGIRLLSDAPQPGADGKRIVFLHPKDTAGVLVELCQSVRPARETMHLPLFDGTMAVHASGPEAAPPLIVLHAALGSTDLEMDRFIRLWERSFRCFAIDFMGHGASERSTVPPTWDTYADHVTAVLEHAGLREAAVFGFSMGGGVALAAAARHPDRIARVAAHATNVQWTRREVDRMVPPMREAMAHPGGRWASRLADVHGPGWRDLVLDLIAFTSGLPAAWLGDDALRAIRQPALVSMGDADRYFDLNAALHLRETIPNAQLWILPGLDHPVQGVDAEPFAESIAAFLRAS